MKKHFLFTVLFLLVLGQSFAVKHPDSLSVGRLEFFQNLGQWHQNVLYKAPLKGAAFYVERDGFTVAMLNPEHLELIHEAKHNPSGIHLDHLDASAYHVSFLNRNENCLIKGYKPYYYKYNFFKGKDPEKWASNVPAYSCVSYCSIYDGVDLNVYQLDNDIKYDFVVAPNANPNQIVFQYDGLKSITHTQGMLLLQTFVSRIIEDAPVAYQILSGGDTSFVECKYVLNKNKVSFNLGDYDKTLPLIIDPTLIFSSYSGSVADNWGYTATYDNDGALYGGGIAFNIGYPVTPGAYQVSFAGIIDVAISKFNATGDSLCYATYLGGSSTDIPHSLYVNDNNELYVLGTTSSTDFPTNTFDMQFHGGQPVTLSTSLSFPNGSDIFISKLSADGSQLLASTYIGGSNNDGLNNTPDLRKNYADENRGEIVLDENSNVYVVSSTFSPDFPVSTWAFDTLYAGNQDVCVFKMSQDLSQMIWSSYFGGSGDESGYSLALASDKSVYICGGTTSTNLMTSPSAFQPTLAGGVDGYVAHISPNGNQLIHCTYLGKSGYDQTYLIKNDRNDNVYVYGQTNAPGTEWIYNAQYNRPNGGQMITKLTPQLDTIVWSTTFGTGHGGPDISPTALMVDYCNGIYMSGWGDQSHSINSFGGTSGLEVTSDAYKATTDGSDFYFICISDDASNLVYASFFGGNSSGVYSPAHEHVDGGTSRFDRKGCIYQAVCAGCGGNSLFPTSPDAYSTVNRSGNCNLGVIKMDFNLPSVVADFSIPNAICSPDTVYFINKSQTISANTSIYWDFGDGTNSTEPSPHHFYEHTGYYEVTLIVQDLGSCNFADTLSKNILVLANTVDTLSPLPVCLGDFVQIGLPPSGNVVYNWLADSTLSGLTISNPIATPAQTTEYVLYASSGVCVDTIHQWVEVSSLQVVTCQDTLICKGDSAILWITANPTAESIEWSTMSDFSVVFGRNQLQVRVSPSTSQTYYVRVKYKACEIVSAVTVTVKEVLIQGDLNFTRCFGNRVQLSVQHNAGDNSQYLWQMADGTTYHESNPSVSPLQNISYSIQITSQEGCVAQDSGYIRVQTGTFEQPFVAWCDICEIMLHSQTTVHVTDYGSDYQYQWTPADVVDLPDQPSTTVHPLESTVFSVSVTDTFNCTKTDTVLITVVPLVCDNPYIFVPNAFSPNSDGKNDVLFVRSEIMEEFYFAVYSRWGQKLFETTRLDEGWDGNFNGKPCQNGVYDYYLKVTCADGQTKELSGNVMLVR